MSFDLFLLCPRLDRDVAERFNQFKRPGLPEALHIDVGQCADDSTFWIISQDGEEWAELFIDREAREEDPNRPGEIASGWVEAHFPSRGHPDVLHAIAALAEVANGWVLDPQVTAADVELQVGSDQSGHVERGYYTPAITRQIAELLAIKFQWD